MRDGALARVYEPAMRVCGWAHIRRIVLTGTSGSVLDVGCGPAALCESAGAVYVGVDLRMSMLTRSQQVTTVCADAAALPFSDGAFDTVVSTAFLGLLSPQHRYPVLCEMARVCSGSISVLEPVCPLGPVKRALALSQQPVDVSELAAAGWHVRSVGPRVYAGVYTLVTATPGQSR